MRIKAITVLKVIGRIPVLTSLQMASFMTSALSSVTSYKSRSTILRWDDAEAIEAARAQAMRTAGYSPGVPRMQMYEAEDAGGQAHQHVYAISAAAYIDQIDRALCGQLGEPRRTRALSPTPSRVPAIALGVVTCPHLNGTRATYHSSAYRRTS